MKLGLSRFLIIAAALLGLCSCGSSVAESSGLFRTVPSRSIEVMYFRHAAPALEMLLDSTHIFRSIDLGRFSGNEMVLSYDYSASLVPLLAIEAGHAGKDTSSTASYIMMQARRKGLQTALCVDSSARKAAILISPSSAAIQESLTHIQAGTSILDAPGFKAAAAHATGSEGAIIMRNSASGRWLPREFLKGEFERRQLVDFFRSMCEWTVIVFGPGGKSNLSVTGVGFESKRYLLSSLSGLRAGSCKVGDIFPGDAELVLDLPLADWRAYYDARCEWLDANSRLLAHRRDSDRLKSETGIKPLDWAAGLCPQELALISWGGHKVLGIRAKNKIKTPNVPAGFTSVLFGDAFSLPDESSSAVMGKWIISGSSRDVDAFISLQEHEAPAGLSDKGITFAVFSKYGMVSGTSGGIRLNLY